MILEFHPEAELELIEAAAYYESRVPGLGERLALEIRAATDSLQAHPELGVRLDSDLRRLIVTRFPYALIYTATEGVLRIVAVAHQQRLPNYWRSRLGG
jgi:toxin ParE1/3/4